MKIDLEELFIFFDELTSVSDKEQGVYWLKTQRSDGLIVTFAFSIYEAYVDIIIHNTSKVDIISLSLDNCSEVRVLDQDRKCLEVLHDNKRCFLSLLSSPVLKYTSTKNDTDFV